MKLEFQFDIGDWVALQEHHLLQNKQFKTNRWVMTMALPLIIAFPIFFEISQGDINWWKPVIFVVVSASWIWLYPKRLLRRTLDRTKRMLREGGNDKILGTHTLEFKNDRIVHTNPISKENTKWENVVKLEQAENHYFLFIGEQMAIIIPKQKILGQLDELESLFRERGVL